MGDGHFSIQMRHVQRYVHETQRDVSPLRELWKALHYNGGVVNSTAELVQLNRNGPEKCFANSNAKRDEERMHYSKNNTSKNTEENETCKHTEGNETANNAKGTETCNLTNYMGLKNLAEMSNTCVSLAD